MGERKMVELQGDEAEHLRDVPEDAAHKLGLANDAAVLTLNGLLAIDD